MGVAVQLLFKNHRLLILMCQTRALRTEVPKSTMLLFLLVLVCPSLSWRINPSPALSKMTTTSSLETSTGREHCQTTSCTEEGLFPEGVCHPDFCQCDCTPTASSGSLRSCLDSLKHCEEGTFFNTITQVCDWPWNNPECSNPGTHSSTTTTSSPTTTNTTTSTTTTTTTTMTTTTTTTTMTMTTTTTSTTTSTTTT